MLHGVPWSAMAYQLRQQACQSLRVRYVNIQYIISVDMARPMLAKNLKKTLEFILETPVHTCAHARTNARMQACTHTPLARTHTPFACTFAHAHTLSRQHAVKQRQGRRTQGRSTAPSCATSRRMYLAPCCKHSAECCNLQQSTACCNTACCNTVHRVATRARQTIGTLPIRSSGATVDGTGWATNPCP